MDIDSAANTQHQGCQSEVGNDGDQGELEERDEKDEAGDQDESRELGMAPSQDTELYWLSGSSKILRISSIP